MSNNWNLSFSSTSLYPPQRHGTGDKARAGLRRVVHERGDALHSQRAGKKILGDTGRQEPHRGTGEMHFRFNFHGARGGGVNERRGTALGLIGRNRPEQNREFFFLFAQGKNSALGSPLRMCAR